MQVSSIVEYDGTRVNGNDNGEGTDDDKTRVCVGNDAANDQTYDNKESVIDAFIEDEENNGDDTNDGDTGSIDECGGGGDDGGGSSDE